MGNQLEANALLQLGVSLGGKLDLLNRQLQRQAEVSYRRSIPFVGGLAGINGQTAVKVLQGPEGGFEWHVRRLSLAPPLSGTVSQQGTLIIGKGTGLQTSGQGGEGQLVGTGGGNFTEVTRVTTVPNAITFSSTQLVLKYPMNLIVLWVNGQGQLSIDGDAEEILLARQTDFES